MKSINVFVVMFLIMLATVSAASVSYTLTATATNGVDTQNFTQDIVQTCDVTCSGQIPTFNSVPEGYNINAYALDYPVGSSYTISFSSTGNKQTTVLNDLITIEIGAGQPVVPGESDIVNPPATETPLNPTIKCDDTQCDLGCSRCKDDMCHPAGFECKEEITIDKIVPASINLGANQLNILVRNTGTVQSRDIYAEVSGDGIITTEKLHLEKLVPGDKDYLFVKITASKSGMIDLVVRMYVSNGTLQQRDIQQINVVQDSTPTVTADEALVANLTKTVDALRAKNKELEQLYFTKKSDGFSVDGIDDRLKNAHNLVVQAQSALYDQDYKKVQSNSRIANDELNSITDLLNEAKKPTVTFMDKVKNNIGYIASIITGLMVIISAIGLVRSHVNKEKLKELSSKLRIKKGEKKEEKVDEKKEEKNERKNKESRHKKKKADKKSEVEMSSVEESGDVSNE